jgi:hypothetical protein
MHGAHSRIKCVSGESKERLSAYFLLFPAVYSPEQLPSADYVTGGRMPARRRGDAPSWESFCVAGNRAPSAMKPAALQRTTPIIR